MKNQNYTAILKNWSLVEGEYKYIVGNIYSDTGGILGGPRWNDGARVYTSMVLENQIFKSGQIIRTRNSTYLLE